MLWRELSARANNLEYLNSDSNDELHSELARKNSKNLLKAIALNEIESVQQRSAGTTSLDQATVKGKVLDHLWWLQQEGYKESTILSRSQILRYMGKKVNLINPVAVREYIARISSSARVRCCVP